jgi:hypothetical protein
MSIGATLSGTIQQVLIDEAPVSPEPPASPNILPDGPEKRLLKLSSSVRSPIRNPPGRISLKPQPSGGALLWL